MAIVNRGFKGRRRQAGAGLIPPGQYVVDDFPVLTAGPTPFTSLQDWDFSIVDETEAPAARWTWDEFRALPAEDVTVDASRGFDEYNFRTLDEYAAMGRESMRDSEQPYDMPGSSCFLKVDDRVFHTYSVYARGLESTGGSYYFLDLTALGRQEDWEEPKGRSDSVRTNQPDFSS